MSSSIAPTRICVALWLVVGSLAQCTVDTTCTSHDVSLFQVGFDLAGEEGVVAHRNELRGGAGNADARNIAKLQMITQQAGTQADTQVHTHTQSDSRARTGAHRRTDLHAVKQLSMQAVTQALWSVPSVRIMYVVLFALFACVVLHEMAFHSGPALGTWAAQRQYPVQLALVLFHFDIYASSLLVVPVSYDLAQELGKSAASSALLLSISCLLLVVGAAIAKWVIGDENNWDQALNRRAVLISSSMGVATNLLAAAVVLTTSLSDDTVWILLLSCFAAKGLFAGYVFLSIQVMGVRATPPSDRTIFEMVVIMMRNYGLMAGPLISSAALILSGMMEAPARTQLTPIMVFGSLLSMSVVAYFALIVPTELPEWQEDPGDVRADRPKLELAPEDMTDDERRELMWRMAWYIVESAFTFSGIELASVMIFEVEYGMNSTQSGMLLGTVGTVAASMNMIFIYLIHRGLMRESTTLQSCVMTALFGGLLLFEGPWGGGFVTLLLADLFFYSMSSVANGVAQGWASRASKDGTDFGPVRLKAFMVPTVMSARVVMPPVTRFLVDIGGRNLYASIQFCIVCLGARTVYKGFKIYWAAEIAQAQAASKSEPKRGSPENHMNSTVSTDFSNGI